MQQYNLKTKTPKQKLLLLLFISVIAVAAMTMSAVALAKPGCPGHPSCKDTDEDSGITRFTVVISGNLSGTGNNWVQDSGQSLVRYQDFWNDENSDVNGKLTDLSFFRDSIPGGEICFPKNTEIFAANLTASKRGAANAQIWFNGWTNDDDPVLYYIGLKGEMVVINDFPPADSNIMNMTSWSTNVENQGKKIKDISCIGKGDMGDSSGFEGVFIDVTRNPPED